MQKPTRRAILGAAGLLSGSALISPTAVAAPTAPALATLPSDSIGIKAFEESTTLPSRFFRIPFLLNTSAGTLIAGCDANRATTGDSADNIDAVIRRKADAAAHPAAASWSAPQIIEALDMRDFVDNSGYAQESASVIDGVITQDRASGKIILLIDAFPWNGGVFEHLNVNADGSVSGGRNRAMPLGDGFATVAGRSMLLLSTQNITGDADGKQGNINRNIDRSRFNLVADIDGPRNSGGRIRVFNLVGTPNPYTESGANDSNLTLGSETNYSLDDRFAVYQNGAALTVRPLPDSAGAAQVPMRIFYKRSVLQMFNTNHILQVSSSDEGASWQMDGFVTSQFRSPDSRNCLLAPGRAFQMRGGEYAGRIVVPVYTQRGSRIDAEAVLSDDGGNSWFRGDRMPASFSLHESAIIETFPGQLRSFNRHSQGSGGKVLTAESVDGGVSWTPLTSALGDNAQGVSCQVSALTLAGPVMSPEAGELRPGVIMMTPMDRSRTHGVAHIGAVHQDGVDAEGRARTRIEWFELFTVTRPGEKFAYGSMDQLANGRLAMLFEASRTASWADGLRTMYYREYALDL